MLVLVGDQTYNGVRSPIGIMVNIKETTVNGLKIIIVLISDTFLNGR